MPVSDSLTQEPHCSSSGRGMYNGSGRGNWNWNWWQLSSRCTAAAWRRGQQEEMHQCQINAYCQEDKVFEISRRGEMAQQQRQHAGGSCPFAQQVDLLCPCSKFLHSPSPPSPHYSVWQKLINSHKCYKAYCGAKIAGNFYGGPQVYWANGMPDPLTPSLRQSNPCSTLSLAEEKSL